MEGARADDMRDAMINYVNDDCVLISYEYMSSEPDHLILGWLTVA